MQRIRKYFKLSIIYRYSQYFKLSISITIGTNFRNSIARNSPPHSIIRHPQLSATCLVPTVADDRESTVQDAPFICTFFCRSVALSVSVTAPYSGLKDRSFWCASCLQKGTDKRSRTPHRFMKNPSLQYIWLKIWGIWLDQSLARPKIQIVNGV